MMGNAYVEQWTDTPLADIIPAYIYKQYQDDDSVLAFASGINALAQPYLDWFNQVPMAVYTNPNVAGGLLDWVGNNLYGIARPVISTTSTKSFGSVNSYAINSFVANGFFVQQSGTAVVATDDIYRRVLTWYLWKGDGVQMSLEWLRRRIARFLYGANGSGIDVGLIPNVSIVFSDYPVRGPVNTLPANTLAVNAYSGTIAHRLTILVPNTTMGTMFVALFEAGILPAPVQLTYLVGVQ